MKSTGWTSIPATVVLCTQIHSFSMNTTGDNPHYHLWHIVSRRLESKGPKTCKFVIVANLEFVTKTMMRGKIETELWSGQQKSVGLLKEHLKAAETPSPSPTSTASPTGDGVAAERVQGGAKVEKAGRAARPARVKLYPDNYQYTGQVILVVILLILSLLVVALFKLAATLERMDQRLSNIELAFNAMNMLGPDQTVE